MIIKFTIPGSPMGKGRPKFARRGKFTATYTPEKTANYETLVKWYFQQAAQGQNLKGALKADIFAYFPITKTDAKKKNLFSKMISGIIRPTKKPDWDNIGKIVCDALNKMAYDDDSSIVDGRVRKYYSDQPKVEVTISEIVNFPEVEDA
ncbi:MAG TPA: RusA family crossover junction endodeoxyribonuclease [Clostridia bacterium]|nr:RusA family crossover junction endodeoxyribonuclease [Clostridia bacterium]